MDASEVDAVAVVVKVPEFGSVPGVVMVWAVLNPAELTWTVQLASE